MLANSCRRQGRRSYAILPTKISLFVLALLAVSAPAQADDSFSLGIGIDYSTGKYGNAESTRILYVPVTAKYETGDWSLKLIVPYISVTGPGGVIMGVGNLPAGNANSPAFGLPPQSNGKGKAVGRGGGVGGANSSPTAPTSTQSGLGDVVAYAGYTFYSVGALSLDAVGKIKFGTADANKGLGTGQNDYSAELDGYYLIEKETTLMATAGYKIVGAPAGIPLGNVPYGMLGVDRKIGEAVSAGVMYNVVGSVTPTIPDQKDVMLYATHKLSAGLKLQAYLTKGFTISTPDYGGGLVATAYF